MRALAREQEIGQIADHVARLSVDGHAVAVGDAFDHRALGVELRALLIEVRDLQPGAAPDLALVRLDLPYQQPQQRALAGAVRPDQADAIAAHDPRREIADDADVAVRTADAIRLEHHLAGGLRLVDL